MSKRTKLYRWAMGKSWQETADNLMQRHKRAVGKKSGVVCSLPMSVSKANRLAAAIHSAK